VAQVVEPSKHETLSSNPNNSKKKKKRRRKKNEGLLDLHAFVVYLEYLLKHIISQ
jgi:hypothetical protein